MPIEIQFAGIDRPSDDVGIDGKKSEETDHRIDDIGDSAHNGTLVKETRNLIKSLITAVKNHFRRDFEILAEWATVSRIHLTGGSGPEDSPPPAPLAPLP